MQVFSSIRNLPENIDHLLASTADALCGVIRTIDEKVTDCSNYIVNSALWIETGRPLYARYVEPLTKTDYIVVATITFIALAIAVIARKLWSSASLPIALLASTTCVGTAYYYVNYRLDKHFNVLAWNEINAMKAHVRGATPQTPLANNFEGIIGTLRKPEYRHLNVELHRLEEQYRQFREALRTPQLNDQKTLLISHLDALSQSAQGNDKALFDQFRQAANTIGTPAQDLQAFQTHFLALSGVRDQRLRQHADLLQQGADNVKKALNNVNIDTERQGIITHLEQLQRRLQPWVPVPP